MSSGCKLCDQAMQLSTRLLAAQKDAQAPDRRNRLAHAAMRALWRFEARWYLHRQVCALEYKEREGYFPTWDRLMHEVAPDLEHHTKYGYQRRAQKLCGGGE